MKLNFHSNPVMSKEPKEFPTNDREKRLVHDAISDMLGKGAIKKWMLVSEPLLLDYVVIGAAACEVNRPVCEVSYQNEYSVHVLCMHSVTE